ncbi:MAG: FAD-dependent oxidoreductase, partial [Coriobacteriia bacterium]|nr:FAD-dependent oxidoreductase [Coriobacteriia bacterium]
MPDNERVLVLGSGTAGTSAARSLSDAGWSVTVVERDKVGGTCLWHGCMPKKALETSAHARRRTLEVEQFGIDCDSATYDWPAVLAWKWHA